MYEENNRGFVFGNIILKLLVAVIVVILIIWLFPTKGYINNQIDKKIGVSDNQIFTNNINTMKQAALGYYTGNRLPQNDKTVKMTLKEMLEKNLITEITDNEGKSCDKEKSYIEVTKEKEDYKLKVNLTCKNKEEYVVSYFGNYDYCTSGVCEKKKLTENEAEETNSEVTNMATECQYSKATGGYWTNYGNWSNWTTQQINSSNSRQVQTKTEKVQIGTKTVQTGTTTQKYTPKKLTFSNGSVVYECGSEYTNAGRYTSPKYCLKTVPKYEQTPVYKNVTYYKYRDRKYISNSTDYKWSTCDNSELLNKGYIQTGQTR